MTRLLMWLQHKLNPLHVYCRLNNDLEICKERAMPICELYEKTLFRIIDACIRFMFRVCQLFGRCKDVVFVKDMCKENN